MKRTSFLIAVAIGIGSSIFAQTTKKVLFIGNSYTASNNLPALVSNMANNSGDVLIYDSNTPGGHRLMNHASNATTLAKINAETWDFVALQAQSQETSWDEAQMATELYPFATQLSEAIRANNPCSQPLFYMTWGRENGDASNCPFVPWVCTYEGMDDAIRTTYIKMAQDNAAEVTPVGAVWRYLRTNHPDIDLYSGDGSHPSLAGSYAAACAFYTNIFEKDPTLLTWNSTLSESTANTIKLAAKTVVFDVIASWDYKAYFTNTISHNVVSFNQNFLSADSWVWDFGDGQSSNAIHPEHTYQQTGDYNVSLTVTSCGDTHVYETTISINSLHVDTLLNSKVSIYPNPTVNGVYVKGLTEKIQKVSLYSINGHLVGHPKVTPNAYIDLSQIDSGVYVLEIETDFSIVTHKVVKL